MLTVRPWPVDALQLIGDGLRMAIDQQIDGVAPLAAECIAALRDRGWIGDEELAETLPAGMASASAQLVPLAVDLEELAWVLEGDPAEGSGRIDLQTGEVWPEFALDEARDSGEDDVDDDDPDRWLWVRCEGSRAGYRDMERFVDDIDDADIADELSTALRGRGPFRRFKDALHEWPELLERWYAFAEDRQRGRARSWLADEGYVATTRQLPPAELST